ncbi:MAG: inositol monophosphatase family protein [Nitrospirota bacterium]|jgi:myo-inositol-1(or 4)-monophosphatase
MTASNDAYLEAAVTIARAAGEVLLDYQRRGFKVATKGHRIDLITDADRASEALVVEELMRRYPDDSILAEESGARDGARDRRWIIDPLDGTTNFAHGYPFYCVSIGLEIAGTLEVGVVHAPAFGETFTATRADGAFLETSAGDRRRLHVSAVAELSRALLVTGFPYDIAERGEGPFDLFRRFVLAAQAVRRDGSAALDLCYLAAGRFDGFWEANLKPWDLAAGTLIAAEAGAEFSDFRGDQYTISGTEIVASNGALHAAMVATMEIP